jgi:hypothetical protein
MECPGFPQNNAPRMAWDVRLGLNFMRAGNKTYPPRPFLRAFAVNNSAGWSKESIVFIDFCRWFTRGLPRAFRWISCAYQMMVKF